MNPLAYLTQISFIRSSLITSMFLLFTLFGNGQNLITNPSAELDPLTNGWTAITGPWTARCLDPNAFHGDCYFFAGVAADTSEIFQDIDVSSNAPNIDAGTGQYIFSGRFRTYPVSPTDIAKVLLDFKDGSDNSLLVWDSGDQDNTTMWEQVLDTVLAPVGTRTISVRLQSIRLGGSDSDGYIDHLYLSDNPVLPEEYGPFPLFDQALLDKHLDIINDTTVWIQASVDTTGMIFQKYVDIDPSYWEDYFEQYFQSRYFSFNLFFYIQHRAFWWNGDDQHLRLQRGLVAGLGLLEERLLSSTPNDTALADSLVNNDMFANTWRDIHEFYHRYLPNEGAFYVDLTSRDSIIDRSLQLVQDYPHFFEKPNMIDHATYPKLYTIRSQVYANLASAVRLDASIKPTVTATLKLDQVANPLEAALWANHSVINLNNTKSDSATLQVFLNYVQKIPPERHDWIIARLQSELNASGGRTYEATYFGNMSYWPTDIPQSADYFFPQQSKGAITERFSIGQFWAISDRVYTIVAKRSHPEYGAYVDTLLSRAGSTIDHYAFNRDHLVDGHYDDRPSWFFNDHFRMYYANSQAFLDLAIERWDDNRPHALSQFLLYPNISSIDSDSTTFYHTGPTGDVTCTKYLVEKDTHGYITKLYLSADCWYEFTLDDDKMVTGLVKNTEICYPELDCPALCSDLITYPDFCALMEFYESTCGPNWTDNTGWSDGYMGTDCDYCDWYGVTCDANNRVTKIDFAFQANGLNGVIPASFTSLDKLERFNIWNNSVYGSLPDNFWNMPNLSSLLLAYNNLQDTLGSALCNAASLTELQIHNNNFSGSIPPCIDQLAGLRTFNIGANSMTGEIPDNLYNCTSLQYLGLYQNQFSGTISESISDLTQLVWLYLHINALSGEIPTSIGQLANLRELNLGNNQFTGNLPDFFADLNNLQSFSVAGNQFTGELPATAGNIIRLFSFDLSSNQFAGCIPFSYQNFCNKVNGDEYSFFNFSNNPGLPMGGSLDLCDLQGLCAVPNDCGFTRVTIGLGSDDIDLHWNVTNVSAFSQIAGSHLRSAPNNDTLEYYITLDTGWNRFYIQNRNGGGLGTGFFELRDYHTDDLILSTKPFDDYYNSQEFPICGATSMNRTYYVTNTNDSGVGSLRAAIDSTWQYFGHDTIEVLAVGVIALDSSGSFQLLRGIGDVTFNGNGIIIDAQGHGRHMSATDHSVFNNITFRNGNSPFSAGSIWVGGQSDGDTTIFDCVLFENNAAHWDVVGGGAFRTAYGTVVKAVNCTFSGNSSAFDGGAIHLQPGSVFVSEYCTFNENMAGRSGGAIYNNLGQLYLTGTILSNSLPAGIEDIYNTAGASPPFTESGNNTSSSIVVNDNNLVENCVGDCPSFTIDGQDPVLGPLQDNGGNTFTHALLASSPAINSDPDPNPMPDGRGYVGTTTRDIGSYEAGASYPAPCEPFEYLITTIGDGQSHEWNASQFLGAQHTVDNNSTVRYTANDFIDLLQGFEIKVGSQLEAAIEDCLD